MNITALGIILIIYACSFKFSAGASYGEACTDNNTCSDTGQVCTTDLTVNTCTCHTDNNYSYVVDKCVKDLGTICTDATDCNYGDNSVICDTNCKCNTASYYDNNGETVKGGSCVAKHAFDEICTNPNIAKTPDQCFTSDAICQAVTGGGVGVYKCQCTIGFHHDGSNCVQEDFDGNPENVTWSTWGNWGGCSVTCGGGTRNRTRTCTPSGATLCSPGRSTEDEACNTDSCDRSLGEQCTQASQCTAQNSECTSSKCTCKSGFYGIGNNCLKRSIGETCTDKSQCSAASNVQCTGTCTCDSGYFAVENSCLKRSIGETCDDVSQCSAASNVQCTGTCTCRSGYLAVGDSCLKRSIGETCDDVSQCSAASNVQCTGTCTCRSGYLAVGDSCLKRSLEQTCTDVSQCSASNAQCSGTCFCQNGYLTVDQACLKRYLGESCSTDSHCSLVINGKCSNGYCSCKSGYYKTQDGSSGQCTKRSNGETCTDTSQCSAASNVQCTGSGTRTCICQSGYFTLPNSCLKRYLDQSCSVRSHCSLVINGECSSSGVCSCTSGYYKDGTGQSGTCKKRHLDESCTASSQCSEGNSECRSSKCLCKSGYYQTGTGSTGTCTERHLDQSCNANLQCKNVNSECRNSICSCISGYYKSGTGSQGTCTRQQLGDPCTDTNQCSTTSSSKCRTGSNRVCVCNYGYYDSNGEAESGGSCILQVSLDNVCPTPTSSVPDTATCFDSNARCMSSGVSSYTCQCISTYYDNQISNRQQCILRRSLGVACSTPVNNLDQCSNSSASCTQDNGVYKCKCNTGYHQEQTGCVANKALGETCNDAATEQECSDPSASCLNDKCTCNSNSYDSNGFTDAGTCMPMTNLQVTNVGFSSIQTDRLTVSWNIPPDYKSHINSLRVTWRATNANNVNTETADLSSTTTSYTMERGLEPGRAYTVTIFSINTQTQQNTQRTTTVTRQQAAKPSIPSGVTSTSDDLDASNGQIIIRWRKGNGIATKYRVKLFDGDSEKVPQETSTLSTTFYNVLNGHKYNVVITAKSEEFNGIYLWSEERNSTIKTKVQVPGQPRNGVCKSPSDSAITLEWDIPTFPNGDLIRYHIDVLDTSSNLLFKDVTTGTKTQKVVGNLDPGTSYIFRLYTKNEQYISSSYDQVSSSCKTRAKMSDPPSNLKVSGVKSRGFDIAWEKPNNTYSEENYGYVLQVKDDEGSCWKEVIYRCSDCRGGFTLSELDELCDSTKREPIVDKTKTELANKLMYSATLDPDISYTISVTAINDAERGHPATVTQRTLEEAPQKPYEVIVVVKNATSFGVTWKLDEPRPGQTTYLITFIADAPALSKNFTVSGFGNKEYTASGLQEYWNYSVLVTASTSIGSKKSAETNKYRTLPAAPGKVSDFNIDYHPGGNYTAMKISWKMPEVLERNGIIASYKFEHFETTKVTDTKNFKQEAEGFIYTITIDVTPEKMYNLTVYAINDGDVEGEKHNVLVEAPAGVPISIEETQNISVIPKKEAKTPTQTSVTVSIVQDFFEEATNGEIRATGLIVCTKKDCTSKDAAKHPDAFNSMKNWKEDKEMYRATNKTWLMDTIRMNNALKSRRKRATTELQYTVGSDNCPDLTSGEYCNGALQPEKSYYIFAVSCTNGGCLVSKENGPFITKAVPDEETNLGLIIGLVVAGVVIIVLVVVIMLLVLRRKKRRGDTMKPSPDDDDDDDFTKLDPTTAKIVRKRPILLNEVEDYVANMHKDSNLLFSAEYDELKTISPKHPCEAADREENRMKNRYINIIPFDHTRVKLSTNGEDDTNDYINGNYLPGYNSPREYIGCQGAIPGTIDDFWRMTWEQNVSVIVMLTLCKEGQKIKCEQYWPDEVGEPKQYGDVIVEITSYSNIRTYDYRMFKITNGSTTRVVKHFHFLSWLDFQANVHHDIILDFIQHVRQHVQPPDTSGPMIIHCSAGVGRTGTYIALDHLMQYINEHDFDVEIDIFDLVLKLRENRQHMVQTEQQYVFIHDCVKEIKERKRKQMENIYENQAFSQEENIYQNEQSLYANVSISKAEQNTEL